MRLLVTGGAGFIGSAVVRQANRAGHQVVNLDALNSTACLENGDAMATVPGDVFEQTEIRDRGVLAHILAAHETCGLTRMLTEADHQTKCGTVFAYQVSDPEHYGVVGFDEAGKVTSIAGNFVQTLEKRQGIQVGCPEEIAIENGGLSRSDMDELAKTYAKNDYGQYLSGLLSQRRLAA